MESFQEYEDTVFLPKRIRKKLHLRLLTGDAECAEKLSLSDKDELRETRLLPVGFGTVETIMLFDETVIMVTDNLPVVGIHIEDAQISTMFQNIFEHLWT